MVSTQSCVYYLNWSCTPYKSASTIASAPLSLHLMQLQAPGFEMTTRRHVVMPFAEKLLLTCLRGSILSSTSSTFINSCKWVQMSSFAPHLRMLKNRTVLGTRPVLGASSDGMILWFLIFDFFEFFWNVRMMMRDGLWIDFRIICWIIPAAEFYEHAVRWVKLKIMVRWFALRNEMHNCNIELHGSSITVHSS